MTQDPVPDAPLTPAKWDTEYTSGQWPDYLQKYVTPAHNLQQPAQEANILPGSQPRKPDNKAYSNWLKTAWCS